MNPSQCRAIVRLGIERGWITAAVPDQRPAGTRGPKPRLTADERKTLARQRTKLWMQKLRAKRAAAGLTTEGRPRIRRNHQPKPATRKEQHT